MADDELTDKLFEAINPLLRSLEDLSTLSKQPITSNNLSTSEPWNWFLALPTLEQKRNAISIRTPNFTSDWLQLLSLASSKIHSCYSFISETDLAILSLLGDSNSKFTCFPNFTLQQSRLLCEGLGIEYGLQCEIDKFIAGNFLSSHLVRMAREEHRVCLSTRLLSEIPLLNRTLYKASFGKFLTGATFNPERFTLGEYICHELELALLASYNSRESIVDSHSSPVDYWETSTEVDRARTFNRAMNLYFRCLREHLTTSTVAAAGDVFVLDRNPLFFHSTKTDSRQTFAYMLSHQIELDWKEMFTLRFLLELESEEDKAAARRKSPPTRRVRKLKRVQQHAVAPPPTRDHGDLALLSTMPQDVASSQIEIMSPRSLPPSQDHSVGDKSEVEHESRADVSSSNLPEQSDSDITPAVIEMNHIVLVNEPPPLPPVLAAASTMTLVPVAELNSLILEVRALAGDVIRLSQSNGEIQSSLVELKAILTMPPVPPPPPPLPQPPTTPSSPPLPTATLLPPSSSSKQQQQRGVPPPSPQISNPHQHPFFGHHNNATHHFRSPITPSYQPHYPSPPHPVYARPHEWHGTEMVFSLQPPQSSVAGNGGGSNANPPSSMQHQATGVTLYPQLFEHGLLPVDPICAANLTKGILSFAEHCRVARLRREPSEQALLGTMQSLVESVWPRARVKAFGSSATNLALPESDMDLVVCLPKVTAMRDEMEKDGAWQQKLMAALMQASWVDSDSLKRIQNASMPIITLTTRTPPPTLQLDISFQNDSHFGLETNKLVNALQEEHSMLRPLVLVLKQFLLDRGLGKGFSGGLSSYALVIMCTCFLNASTRLVREGAQEDMGVLVVCFLRFFGEQFDPRLTGISIARGFFQRHLMDGISPPPPIPNRQHNTLQVRRRSFRVEDLTQSGEAATGDPLLIHKFDPLLIEDPLQAGNNVGRNVFRIHQIQRACADTAKTLRMPSAWPLGCIVESWPNRPLFASTAAAAATTREDRGVLATNRQQAVSTRSNSLV